MSNPQKDAEDLKKAMEGFGCDKKTIIQIIANRTNIQRQKIKLHYKSSFGRDLKKDLKSELHGNLELAIISLLYTPIEYDVKQLRKAMKGFGTDEGTLIEIICSRPNNILKEIKVLYKEKYNKELEDSIKSETNGDLKRLLISLLQCNRNDNNIINKSDCEKKAKELYDAGEGKKEKNSEVFNKIFTLCSPMELIGISKAYFKLTGHTILQAINNQFSGNFKELLYSIVYAILNPSEYFATRIHKAIKGIGTNDNLLIRILVSRNEIDIPQIKYCYKQLYGKDMIEDIKGDCSGAYRDLLIELASH